MLAVRDLTFPPLSGGPYSPVARNVSRLARLTLDGVPVYTAQFQWSPFGFKRRGGGVETTVAVPLRGAGVLLSATVAAAPGTVVAVELAPEVREYSSAAINCSATNSWKFPTKDVRDCWNWFTPRSFANESGDFRPSTDSGALLSTDAVSGAVTAVVFGGGSTAAARTVGPSGALTLHVAVAVGTAAEGAAAVAGRARAWGADVPAAMAAAAAGRERRWAALFNASAAQDAWFGGSLPVLVTDDAALRAVYYLGAASTLEVQRSTARLPGAPANPQNMTFTVGGGGNATTNFFFWDQSYAATAFALMAGPSLRSQLLEYIEFGGDDATSGWGIDYMAKGGHVIGAHYAANDMSIFKGVLYYAFATADWQVLDVEVRNKTVLAWMEGFATAYRNLTADGAGGSLADYGGAHQLLECVQTYVHEVASFNAANVWMLRQLARLLRAKGATPSRAAAFEAEADAVAAAVRSLYRPGEGYFNARSPNGSETGVMHVIDFVYVSEFMDADLTAAERADSASFVRRELQTPTWMRALSQADPAAPFSDRTDHGSHGAYDGWPPLTVAALSRSGFHGRAADFLRNVSAVARLGPFGQAHGIRDDDPSAVYKPFEFTLYNELCGLDFVDAVITGLAGLQPTAAAVLEEGGDLPIVAPGEARGANFSLRALRWQGALWDVHVGGQGVRWSKV